MLECDERTTVSYVSKRDNGSGEALLMTEGRKDT